MRADQDGSSRRKQGPFTEQGDLKMVLTEGEEERKVRKTHDRWGCFFFFLL